VFLRTSYCWRSVHDRYETVITGVSLIREEGRGSRIIQVSVRISQAREKTELQYIAHIWVMKSGRANTLKSDKISC
jgi:predicted house-cleaning NTP pyrophosphatase (Maf/HAM1 superfamily)